MDLFFLLFYHSRMMIATHSSHDASRMIPSTTDRDGHVEEVRETTKPHPESAKDLDPDCVEDIAETKTYRVSQERVQLVEEPPALSGYHKSTALRSTLHTKEDGVVVGEFGQDRVSTQLVKGVWKDKPFSVRIAVCADGHGSYGEFVSGDVVQRVHVLLDAPFLAFLLEKIVGQEELQESMDALFQKVEEATTRYEHEGTTLSLLMVWQYDGRAFVLTANVGDSPLLLIDNATGKVRRLHEEHNWDSRKERQVHLAASREAGRNDAVVIYSRFNCDNGRSFPDPWGGQKVIPMFEEGTDKVHEANRRHVMQESKNRGSVGGCQSLRRMKILRFVGGETPYRVWEEEALEEFGHENFGSTPLIVEPVVDSEDPDDTVYHGGCQMTRGLGDHFYKEGAPGPHIPLLLTKPSVTLLELNPGEDLSYLVCSDGIGDVFYWHQIGDVFQRVYRAIPEASCQKAGGCLFREVFARGRRFHLPEGVRCWDDLSMVVGRIRVERVEEEEG